jgi:transposase
MGAEELSGLTVGELVALVLRLQARVAELEARLAEPPKTSGNSSVPPSKSFKPNRKPPAEGKRKRGPKVGHPGATRVPATPDLTVEVRVGTCGGCGQDLREVPQEVAERRQVVEVPPVRPVVIEAVGHAATCPRCGARQRAAFPAAFSAPRAFGPRVQALASYLHEVQHIPYLRLQGVMGEVLGLGIARGSLVNLVRRTGAALAPAAESIRREVAGSAVVGSDETGARVDGWNEWQWVFRTAAASYHVIRPSRGADVIAEALGGARPEVWVSDLFSAQLKAPAARFQVCHAHQLRDLAFAEECGDRKFAPAMRDLLRESQALAKERPDLPPAEFAARRRAIEAACDELLAEDALHPKGQKLQRRYRAHRDKLFVFLERPDVPPDNNGSERDLRDSVVHRKVTGGFRSDWAPATYAATATVVETARKRGQAAFPTLLAHIGHALPIHLGPSPPIPPT